MQTWRDQRNGSTFNLQGRRPRLRLGVLAAIVGLFGAVVTAGLGFASPASAGTFNIACGDVYGPNGLVAAINTANSSGGGTINLTSGCTYTLTTVDNATVVFGPNGLPVVSSPISVNGNGATIARSQVPATPVFRIFEVNGTGNLTLNNLTVTGGRATNGGGIFNVNGMLALKAAQVSNNTATDPLFTSSGGGIANFSGTTTLNHSRVTANTATHLTDASGGGITSLGTLIVNNSVVNNNTASAANGAVNGAGIDNGGTLTMNSSQVNNNTASGANVTGGGLANLLGPLATLNDSQVSNNTASSPGIASGAGIANLHTLNLNLTRVVGNTVTGTTAQGGGLFNSFGSATLFVSLLDGNTVNTSTGTAQGGGIFNNNGGSVTLRFSADIANTASGTGAGGGGVENNGGTVTLGFSLVVANIPNNCRPPGSVPGCIG